MSDDLLKRMEDAIPDITGKSYYWGGLMRRAVTEIVRLHAERDAVSQAFWDYESATAPGGALDVGGPTGASVAGSTQQRNTAQSDWEMIVRVRVQNAFDHDEPNAESQFREVIADEGGPYAVIIGWCEPEDVEILRLVPKSGPVQK